MLKQALRERISAEIRKYAKSLDERGGTLRLDALLIAVMESLNAGEQRAIVRAAVESEVRKMFKGALLLEWRAHKEKKPCSASTTTPTMENRTRS
jgi:hypothetical protein